MKTVKLLTAVLVLWLFVSCEKKSPTEQEQNGTHETGTVTDIDGNVYQTVKIGNQWWMAENLKVTHFRNGVAIPNVINGNEWYNLTSGAYCNYNNEVSKTSDNKNDSDVTTYGRL